jgi:ABC-type uncharacterized transport system auxiliary subunit
MKFVWPVLLLAACKVLPEPKPSEEIQYWTVNVADLRPAERTYDVNLLVRPFTAPAQYDRPIVVRQDPYRIKFLQQTQWVAPPADLAYQAMEKLIRTSRLFEPRGPDSPEWDLEGTVLEFDQMESGAAALAISFELRRRATGERIWAGTYRAEVPAGEGRLPESMSRALRIVGERLVADLLKEQFHPKP